MGTELMGKGHIECRDIDTSAIKDWLGIAGDSCIVINVTPGYISFEMYGRNYIDYQELSWVADKISESEMEDVTINVNEWVESEDGFYRDIDEERVEQRQSDTASNDVPINWKKNITGE